MHRRRRCTAAHAWRGKISNSALSFRCPQRARIIRGNRSMGWVMFALRFGLESSLEAILLAVLILLCGMSLCYLCRSFLFLLPTPLSVP